MNWAELHEISETLKASHESVGYRKGTAKEHCGNCKNYIPAADGNRCRTVDCPIAAGMWCQRFKCGGP